MKKDFTGFVLAGGKSSRMKTDKAFLNFGGKTFLENAVEILKPNCENVRIVLNKSQTDFIEKLPAETSCIFDINENRGAPGGMHAAFTRCTTEFAVILAVDLPFVSIRAIGKLCEIARHSQHFSAFAAGRKNGELQPLCAVYRVEKCLPKLEKILSENDSASVKNFLETVNVKIITSENLSDDQNFLANVNSPQDFLKINNR